MADIENKLVLVSTVDFDAIVDKMLRPGRSYHNDYFVRRTEEVVRRLFEQVSSERQEGDELWWAHSARFDPEAMFGDEGVALVRAGQVVRYEALVTY